jgi:tetratricopeptide (TPR) repeat protein
MATMVKMNRSVPLLLAGMAWFTLAAGCTRESDPAPAAGSFETLVQEGTDQFNRGQYTQALESYKKALEKEPKAATVYNLMGMAYRFHFNQTGDPALRQQELAAFRKAVEIQPDFPVALVNLGATLYAMGDKTQAAIHFKRALELLPNHPEAAELKRRIAEGEAPASPAAGSPPPPPASGTEGPRPD